MKWWECVCVYIYMIIVSVEPLLMFFWVSSTWIQEEGSKFSWEELTQTYAMVEECLTTNYYGAKKVTEAFLPLLQLSNSPRIVNVSSQGGLLKV